eukprot:787916-Amphidinium_carterae.1
MNRIRYHGTNELKNHVFLLRRSFAEECCVDLSCVKDMTFLHQTLAETTGCIETQRDGWYAVMPDTMAGPDVVLFQVTDSSVS